MEMNCIFSDPVNLGPAKQVEDYEFSKVNCEFLNLPTSTIEKIENEENFFYLDKKISYGEFLIVAFLIILLLGLMVGGIREFAKNRKLERL